MRLLGGLALASLGVLIMYVEGQYRPDPGVGFALASCLILGGGFLVGKGGQ